MTGKTPGSKFHDALTAADLEYAGVSWGGFNVFGDRASVDEVKRLMYLADSVPHLRSELAKARADGEQKVK